MWKEAVFGSLAFFTFLAWVAIEFLGLLRFVNKLLHVTQEPESVEYTARLMEEAPYAATRNARQGLERPRGG